MGSSLDRFYDFSLRIVKLVLMNPFKSKARAKFLAAGVSTAHFRSYWLFLLEIGNLGCSF